MQRILVVVHRNFGTASRSHSQTPMRCIVWSMKMPPMSETLVDKYPHTLRNVPEERTPQLDCGRRLKSCRVKTAQTRILKSSDIYLVTIESYVYLEKNTLIFKVFLRKSKSSVINVNLTLVCPCIVSIIANGDQQDATISLYLFIYS